MKITDDALAALFREMAREEGALLRAQEPAWRGRVPESFDRAALSAIAAPPPPAAAPPVKAAGVPRLVKTAAAVLTAAAVAGGAASVSSPALRESFTALLARETAVPARAPEDYVIPSPGEDFAVTEELKSGTMVYAWFTAGTKEVLVEIARRLPETPPENAGYVLLSGTLLCRCLEDGGRLSLWLEHAGTQIQLVFFDLPREAAVEYAERFAEANGIQ